MSELRFNVPLTNRSYRDGPCFKVSSERREMQGINPVTPGLVVQHAIHYITADPTTGVKTVSIFHGSNVQTENWYPRSQSGITGFLMNGFSILTTHP